MRYDFRSLSPYDFELVVRDSLQAELAVRIEAFMTGRDRGIDLRYAPTVEESLIIQCKHWAGSGFDALLRHMRDAEYAKIEALTPKRYILATSVPMSQDRKRRLLEVLRPYVAGPEDILGAEDINNLLGRHPDVERAHFKLWLTSTSVLQAVLNNDIYVRSLSLRETLTHRLRVYVQNKSFNEARDVLENHHAVIIAGVPGIGKSILAEMLVVSYIDEGYEPIVISGDVTEAQRVYVRQKRQVFYYDDFLGQTTSAEKFGKNEDARLTEFMRQVRASRSKRLILTTREYILAQAGLAYERFDRAVSEFEKVVIDLADYTRFDKAHILYNHLYFAELPPEAIDSVLGDRRYHAIISHRNYSPRLIEAVTSLAQRDEVPPTKFADYMIGTFDNPERIWTHAFERQLSEAAQGVLLALATMPNRVEAESLREATQGLHERRSSGSLSAQTFRDALKTLDDTFVRIDVTDYGPTISFHNPSVRDYMLGRLENDPSEFRLLVETATFFEQVTMMWSYARAAMEIGDSEEVADRLRFPALAEAVPPSIYYEAASRTFEAADLSVEIVGRTLVRMPGQSLERRLRFLIDVATEAGDGTHEADISRRLGDVLDRWTNSTGNKDEAIRILRTIYEADERLMSNLQDMIRSRISDIQPWFTQRLYSIGDYVALRRFSVVVPDTLDDEDLEAAADDFRSWAASEADSILQEDSVDAIDRGLEELREVAEDFGVGVDEYLADDAYETRVREIESTDFDDENDDRAYGAPSTWVSETGAIDSMFESLRDE